MRTLPLLDHQQLGFPEPETALADPNGLLAMGGDLSTHRLIAAYQQGIFPWSNDNEPLLWWTPDPRSVIFPHQLYINRSLRKFLKKHPFQLSVNRHFSGVIDGCMSTRQFKEGTWITAPMLQSYNALHQMGVAHSIEVWHNNRLVGGLYGLSIGGVFCGESMFSTMPNASKVALVALRQILLQGGYQLIDCQVDNPFLDSMGAQNIPRQQFLQILHNAKESPLDLTIWQPENIVLNGLSNE